MPSSLFPRNDNKDAGTIAVVTFIAGAVILVLVIILILLFFKKRRSARSKDAALMSSNDFIPRLERPKNGGRYGRLEDDEEQAWSAEMGDAGADNKGSYAPVR